jgi:phosphodiesterase/alkaline phosphatase D-like protein
MLRLRAHNQIGPIGVNRHVPFGFRCVSNSTARWLRLVAGIWGTSVTVAFLVGALLGGIPQTPTPSDWDIYAQVLVLLLIAIGGTLAWRFEAIGASMITAGAVALGAIAAVEHTPLRALGIALVFYVPGLLFWIDWQRSRSLRAVGILAVAMVAILALGGTAADRIYATYFGPVQPQSPLAAEPVQSVEWIWAGGVTTDAVSIRARIVVPNAVVRLAISPESAMTKAHYLEPVSGAQDSTAEVAAFEASGLTPDTEYWYAVEVDGNLDLSRQGRFRTYPQGAFSFTFAFGSCANEGSNGAVFDTIREADPRFFFATGDFFYANIDANDPARYWEAYAHNLTAPAQAALYERVPIAYVWDDHDYGPNNADGEAPGREAAQTVYREAVPHYPLGAGAGAEPIYQAFTVGRVRFIVTDTRSARTTASQPDDATKTMLGAEQKAWFKHELLAANGTFPVIVWVNTDPWIVPASEGGDGWGGYATERRELADFIADNDIRGLMMLSGDAHMLAIDDGTNSDYATNGGGGFPVFHAAALDRRGSLKGGPYSEGAHPGGGQFGLMTVNDTGGSTIEIVWSGRNWKGEEVISYSFTVRVG